MIVRSKRWRVLLMVGSVWMAGNGIACSRPDHAPADDLASLSIGHTVPPYEAVMLDGTREHIGAGEPITVLNVWATWCAACREEMSDLDSLRRQYGPAGVRVIAVSVDAGDGALVRQFVDVAHVTVPVALDPAGVIEERYATIALPESFVVDRDGRLLWHHTGGIHGELARVRQAIEPLMHDH